MGGALGNFGKTISSNMAGKTGLFSPTGAIGGSGLGKFLHRINTNMSGDTGLFSKEGALGGLGGEGGGLLGMLKNLEAKNTYGDPQGEQSAQPQLYGRAADAGQDPNAFTTSLMQYLQQRRR